jgi:hypothetical protein
LALKIERRKMGLIIKIRENNVHEFFLHTDEKISSDLKQKVILYLKVIGLTASHT